MAKVTYNNLSEKFKKEIKWGVAPDKDQVIEFQWLNIPIVKQNGEMLPVYGLKTLPSIDSIYDPYAEGGGQMVQIAYIERETGNEKTPYDFGKIEFTRSNKCTITISGKDKSKLNLLYYLRAHNLNATNPLATPSSYGYVFKELEPAKTAGQKLKDRKEVTSCENYIYDLKEAELVSMLKALRQPTFNTLEENMSSLIEFIQVKANRDKFNSLSKDVRTPIAALISKAVDLKELEYEKGPMNWIYVDTKKHLTTVPPQTDPYEHLVEYFHNNVNGKAFKEFLEAKIGAINSKEAVADAAEELEKIERKGKK